MKDVAYAMSAELEAEEEAEEKKKKMNEVITEYNFAHSSFI
jgi:hypothetical protein